MIIPRPIRAILSGEMPISSSGPISLASAPDFNVIGPTAELTAFFDDLTRRIGVRNVLPRLFSTLANDGVAYVLVGYGCDACGLGQTPFLSRGCHHPSLIFDEAMVVNPRFVYNQMGNNFLRSLDEIKQHISREGRCAVDEAIANGHHLTRCWSELPLRVEMGQLATVAVPVGTAWGTDTADVMFRNQMAAAGDWIMIVCREVARIRGLTLDNIGTLAGESPVPVPHVTWRC